jgi:hypothetical protein
MSAESTLKFRFSANSVTSVSFMSTESTLKFRFSANSASAGGTACLILTCDRLVHCS